MSLLDKYLKILKSQKFPKCGKEGSWFFIPHFCLQPQKVLFALMVNHFAVDHVITIIKDFPHQTFNKNLCFGHFGNLEWYVKLVWKRKLGHENGTVWCIRVIISQNVLKLFLLVRNFSTIFSSFFQVQIVPQLHSLFLHDFYMSSIPLTPILCSPN